MVIVHLLAAYDEREAQARSIARIAESVPGEHHLVTGRALFVQTQFASVTETGSGLHGFGRRDAGTIRRTVAALGADVVHFHGGPVGAIAAKRWGRIPVVVSMYMWSSIQMRALLNVRRWGVLVRTPVLAARTWLNTVLPRAWYAAALRRAGVCAVITSDPFARERMVGRAVPVVLAEGIVAPEEPREQPSERVFLFAGRAEYSRGADTFAAACAVLAARGIDFTAKFCLLDTGMAARVERELRAAAGGARVEVTVGGSDMAREIANSRAVVLPFRYDFTTLAPNMVAAEALARGVPVIGTHVTCLEAAVDHGETGLLVEADDAWGLAAAMERLCDDEYARELGRNAVGAMRRRWERGSMTATAEWAYRVASARNQECIVTGAGAPEAANSGVGEPGQHVETEKITGTEKPTEQGDRTWQRA